MSEKIDYSKGVYDAKKLGTGRMFILGVQHMFAMFGATVLVPLLTGLSVSTTLLCAGLGTLLFHLITKKKVPAFLGSSFAYLGGFSIVAPMLADADGNLTVANTKMLPYACAAVAFSGLVYLVASLLISTFGIRRIMKFFPPVVTGPIIISIGLILAPSAITNCQSNWLLAFVALGTVIVCNIWGKGMVKILPILIGVLVSYAVALVTGAVDFQKISEAAWLGIPLHKEAMGLFAIDGSPEFISALFTIIPIALATMMEHVGDIAAISATVGHNYINDPGLNRTLMGDGLATTMAGLLGGPANTTYGENTGVLALSKIYDPLVIRIAAVLAIILSFSPKFEAVINTIPTGIIGGISFVLYGMISAIGVRNVVENRVDFTNSRNLIVAAVILVCALGFNSVGGVSFAIAGVNINLSGLAIAAIAGILLNAIRVYEAYALEVEVLGTCHECSAYVYMQRIVASAQLIVADRHLVAVLSDEMEIRLRFRHIYMLFVNTFLDEDEPRLYASLGSCVYGSLHGCIVAGSVLCNHSIVNTCLGLLALHCGEGETYALEGVARAVFNGSGRQCERIVSRIFQTCIFIYNCLSAYGRNNLLTVESCLSVVGGSHNFLVERKYHRTVGRNVLSLVGRKCRHQFGRLAVVNDVSVSQHEYFCNGCSVEIALAAHEF